MDSQYLSLSTTGSAPACREARKATWSSGSQVRPVASTVYRLALRAHSHGHDGNRVILVDKQQASQLQSIFQVSSTANRPRAAPALPYLRAGRLLCT